MLWEKFDSCSNLFTFFPTPCLVGCVYFLAMAGVNSDASSLGWILPALIHRRFNFLLGKSGFGLITARWIWRFGGAWSASVQRTLFGLQSSGCTVSLLRWVANGGMVVFGVGCFSAVVSVQVAVVGDLARDV